VADFNAIATKPEQATANAKAADWHLTTEYMKEIDEILKSRGGER